MLNNGLKDIEIVFTGRIGNCLYCLLNGVYCASLASKNIRFYNKPHGYDEYKKTIFRNYSNVPIVRSDLNKVYEAELNNLCSSDSSRVSFYTKTEIPISFLNEFSNTIDCPREIEDDIFAKYSNIRECVSIHVRRGDYLKYASSFYILDENYYHRAIEILEDKTNEKFKYLVFSDDIKWCKDNLKIKDVDFFEDNDPTKCLYAMSFCKHNIIANSTFSQWGSFLNKNPNKLVVFPNKYNKHKTCNNLSDDGAVYPVCMNVFWKFKE